MAGCNESNCLCPDKDCPRHGKCCECVMAHREHKNLPMCMRIMLEKKKAENK